MSDFLDIDELNQSGSLIELAINNQFSKVYRYGNEVLKVPRKSDFNHWRSGNLKANDYHARVPRELRAAYCRQVPPSVRHDDLYLSYAIWKAHEKNWQYRRLMKHLTDINCGVPETHIVLGRARLGLFRRSLVPIVRQPYIPGPTLKDMLEKSPNQHNPSAVIYQLKPEFDNHWNIIGRAIRCYLENFAERRSESDERESYQQWVSRVFPPGISMPAMIRPVLDMNPSNFVFDQPHDRLWYVDVDPEGIYLAKYNRINQETLCAAIGIHKLGRIPSCIHEWKSNPIGRCRNCGSAGGAWAGSYGPEYWYCRSCKSSTQYSRTLTHYYLSMQKCRKCGQIQL